VVDPCIPSEWSGFRARREFRGAVYNIEVRNPHKVSKGIQKLLVNDAECDKVPVMPQGSSCNVLVIMG
jgi:cellobiose phosphorylase